MYLIDDDSNYYWLGLANTPYSCQNENCVGQNQWSDGSTVYNFGGFMDINILKDNNCFNIRPSKDVNTPITCDFDLSAVCMSKCTTRKACQTLPLLSQANALYNAQHDLTAEAIVR